jgi:hypothetical protein
MYIVCPLIIKLTYIDFGTLPGVVINILPLVEGVMVTYHTREKYHTECGHLP